MRKKLITDSVLLDIIFSRLCQQLIENHGNFSNSVLIGLQPNGIYPASIICQKLSKLTGRAPLLGFLDATFHRDDFRRREKPVKARETKIDFVLEDKRVILIDDVLYTGRTVRAALDAMISFGRPAQVELLALVARRYNRDLPIEANYVGQEVDTYEHQMVSVELIENNFKHNRIWLVTNEH